MHALILISIATVSLAACRQGEDGYAEEKRAVPPSAENRVLDPGGAMSDPNTRIMIAGNQSAGAVVAGPKPQARRETAVKPPPMPSANAHEGH